MSNVVVVVFTLIHVLCGMQGFVLSVTMIREAWDDILRWKRDREVNGQLYKKLTRQGAQLVIMCMIAYEYRCVLGCIFSVEAECMHIILFVQVLQTVHWP